MMVLPYGEEIMIVGRTVLTQSTSVTDGETDGWTDRITITDTMQSIASHGKKQQFTSEDKGNKSQLHVVRKCPSPILHNQASGLTINS